jgi:hypothetical protein
MHMHVVVVHAVESIKSSQVTSESEGVESSQAESTVKSSQVTSESESFTWKSPAASPHPESFSRVDGVKSAAPSSAHLPTRGLNDGMRYPPHARWQEEIPTAAACSWAPARGLRSSAWLGFERVRGYAGRPKRAISSGASPGG